MMDLNGPNLGAVRVWGVWKGGGSAWTSALRTNCREPWNRRARARILSPSRWASRIYA
jgi:hypothetical protein